MQNTLSSERELDPLRFAAAWRAIGASESTAFEVLTVHYAEPHRAYHTPEHIAECLAWFDQTRELAQRPEELELALFFHDAIYEPARRDNEARSGVLFQQLAGSAGVDAARVARVVALIEATASHGEHSGDAALMCDIDLSILGAAPLRYARFERDIRREYACFDELSYRRGRARVLAGFLQRLSIYQTYPFATRLEAQARHNLSQALAALSAQS